MSDVLPNPVLGKTPVENPITPGMSDLNEWPTHYAKFGAGGFEVVQSNSDRDAITPDRRKDKMVLVRDSGDFYQYENDTWTKVPMGSTGSNDFVLSVKDSEGTDNLGIDTLSFLSSIVRVDPNDGTEAVIEPVVSLISETVSDEPSQFEAKANSIKVLDPLEVYSDPDIQLGAVLSLKKGLYEPIHSPSFLAYLKDDEITIAKESEHLKGALWFEDEVVQDSPYIVTDRVNKAYGLQESDTLDPNVTGGTDYLVAYRASMRGTAPKDGYVKAYLMRKKITPLDADEYLKDVNGNIMVVEKVYKTDDELGYLDVTGIVNAQGLKEFTCHITSSFDELVLTDRTEGVTGLLIQAITTKDKTSDSFLQYEQDTDQNIRFSSHYLGSDRFNLDWIKTIGDPVKSGAAGSGSDSLDGVHFYNLSAMDVGVKDDHVHFEDDGKSICDFSFGKVFSAEETRMLHGKTIKVTATLIDKDSGWNLALMKWTGAADKFTPQIMVARANGSPTFQDGWAEVDKLFISEDVVAGDHTVSKNFTVPTDAENYAVIIYPNSAQAPMVLKLKELQVDVLNPFIGHALYAPIDNKEKHLHESDTFAEFTQDNEGIYGLRYTINNKPMPMPCGTLKHGKADIVIDDSVNQVPGSDADGGEGALKFNAEGKATVNATVRVTAGEKLPKGKKGNVRFWFEKVASDGSMVEIKDSEVAFQVTGGDSHPLIISLPSLELDVQPGDRIALKSQADDPDYAYMVSYSADKPMVDIKINFKEITADAGDDAFANVDVSQFDKVFTSQMTVTKLVSNSSFVKFKFVLPQGSSVAVIDAVKQVTDNTVRPVKALDWVYDNSTQELTVSLGETVILGMITIGIYL